MVTRVLLVTLSDLVDEKVSPAAGGVVQDLELSRLPCELAHVPLHMPQRSTVVSSCGANGLTTHQQLYGCRGTDSEWVVTAADEEVHEVPVDGEGR